MAGGTNARDKAKKYIAKNRAATFHYEISERFEAGIVLKGSEVKSLRDGKASIVDAYAAVEGGQVWLKQMHIASFFAARAFPDAERGSRKLLLHRREIRHLERAVMREGYTLVPLAIYFENGWVKVSLGLGRGKKVHDKRAAIAARTEEREALDLIRVSKRGGDER